MGIFDEWLSIAANMLEGPLEEQILTLGLFQ